MLKSYLTLMRLHRPIGIFLLLWPTLWALWFANQGHPPLKISFIFILGVIIMRSAGCVINDIADRHIDGFVERTQDRPLVSQRISLSQAITLFIFLCSIALLLVLFLNPFCIALSIVGLLLAILYPYTKRVTDFPQIVLGAAFAWAVPMVFAATQNHIPLEAWLLFFSAVMWPIAYDTFYAMADKEDDLKIGVRSTAIYFGKNVRLMIVLVYSLFFSSLWIIGFLYHLKISYFLGLTTATMLTVYQFWITRDESRNTYFRAFLNNNWSGLFIFLGIAANYL